MKGFEFCRTIRVWGRELPGNIFAHCHGMCFCSFRAHHVPPPEGQLPIYRWCCFFDFRHGFGTGESWCHPVQCRTDLRLTRKTAIAFFKVVVEELVSQCPQGSLCRGSTEQLFRKQQGKPPWGSKPHPGTARSKGGIPFASSFLCQISHRLAFNNVRSK